MDFKRDKVKIKSLRGSSEISFQDVISKNINIDDTDIDGEKVMMNIDKGQYFMMNEVGSRIWDIIEKPIKVEEIVTTLLNEYEVEIKDCEDSVVQFLERLNRAELINFQ